jgi:hypothetical protein
MVADCNSPSALARYGSALFNRTPGLVERWSMVLTLLLVFREYGANPARVWETEIRCIDIHMLF